MRRPERYFTPEIFRVPSPLHDASRDDGHGQTSPVANQAARIEGGPEHSGRIEAGSELEPQERPSALFTTTEDRVKLMADAQRQLQGTDLTIGVTYAGELYPDPVFNGKEIPEGHAYVAVTASSEKRITDLFDRVAVLKKEKGKQFAQLGFPKKAK